MTPTLLIDLFSGQRFLISNVCTFFGTPGTTKGISEMHQLETE